MSDPIEINRRNWDERAAIHARDTTGDYMLDRFRAGEDALHTIEAAELGDIAGKRVLHLQCHIGRDTLCLARRHALVTGLDFSTAALDVARGLAAETGLRETFVHGTVDLAPMLTPGPFDLVFSTWGTICWLPDMAQWAGAVASVLAPDGELYLADLHPTFAVLEQDGGKLVPTFDFQTPADRPLETTSATTYTGDPTIMTHQATREWIHSLSAILGSLLDAGLTITMFREHEVCRGKGSRAWSPPPIGCGGSPMGMSACHCLSRSRPAKPGHRSNQGGRAVKIARLILAATLAAAAHAQTALAADTLKLAIGQRGLWDSAIGEIGMQAGIFRKHGLELQMFYTSGGGETQQAVISGSADIGVSPGTLGVLGAFVKGAPIRIIAGEATGTAEYYFVRADSGVQKDFKGVKPDMTLAYSTAGSGTHITALRFMKDYGFTAKLVATGNVPATFTQVMSGQVDIGFSTPPFGLDALNAGKGRLIALANDLPSIRNQTVRLIIANATDLAKRREVYDRFIAAYRETIDYMYANDQALELFAKYADIPVATAKTVRDQFYPKSMLQLDQVAGIDGLMQDAIAFKYIPQALSDAQLKELMQLPKK